MNRCELCCLITVVGTMILSKIQEAVPERNDHCEDFVALTDSLSSKYPDLVSTWEREVQEWEYNSTKHNPFEVKSHGESHFFAYNLAD